MSAEANDKKRFIRIRGANENNLKNLSVDIPRDQFVVLTGLSGSGKSSLAFDTIYAEGQRRYMESLSSYARQFLGQMEKPDVQSIEGLPPAISNEPESPFYSGYGNGDLRLFPTSVCPCGNPALSQMWKRNPQTDGRSDGGSDHDASGTPEDPASCTGSAGPQGNPC